MTHHGTTPHWSVLSVIGVLVLGSPGSAASQQADSTTGFRVTGSSSLPAGEIRGVVRDGASGDPMDDVVVTVPGTTLGALSEPDGSFVLREVPAGPLTLRFQRIGHEDLRAGVEMAEGHGLEVEAAMSFQRIPLCGNRVCGTFGCQAVEAFVRDDTTGSAPPSEVTIRVIGGISADSLSLRADPGGGPLRIGAGASLVQTGPSVDQGPYEVEITAPGYLPWRRLDVRRGECLKVEGSPFQVRLLPFQPPPRRL